MAIEASGIYGKDIIFGTTERSVKLLYTATQYEKNIADCLTTREDIDLIVKR